MNPCWKNLNRKKKSYSVLHWVICEYRGGCIVSHANTGIVGLSSVEIWEQCYTRCIVAFMRAARTKRSIHSDKRGSCFLALHCY